MNVARFVFNSIMLGVGLAMDAFSVSIANALNEPEMKKSKMIKVAGTFAFFQFLMPMIGWFCVHTIVETFQAFQPYIPWIALILLCYIGGKMIYEALTSKGEEQEVKAVRKERINSFKESQLLLMHYQLDLRFPNMEQWVP